MSSEAEGADALNDPWAVRRLGRDWLSLALMDSRNHLLQRLAADESPSSLRRAALVARFQEHWINGHVQRQRGESCDASAPRLAGHEPRLQEWLDTLEAGDTVPVQELRRHLQDTLDTMLDLLQAADDTDAGLYFFRLALLHEDRQHEALALSQGHGTAPARPQRPPLWMPAQRWQLGSAPGGGLVPWAERWAHEVAIPDFEIDAQPVNWSQFVEFAEDGGYDRAELWSPAGWAWLQAQARQGQARRAPRDVEQLRGGVLVQRRSVGKAGPGGKGGKGDTSGKLELQRAAAGQPVTQVSRFEAQAWCTWAGRRLPTEPEWELAACTAQSRGFAWGDVLEWVGGSARAWPGAGPVPPGMLEAGLGERLDALPVPASTAASAQQGEGGVLRGASFAARSRWRHPKARRFASAADDIGPLGFRSCAI